MWKPIYQPEPWPKFVKRKDIIGLPLMEQRRKFMEEQILFENYVSSINTLNTVSTAAAGAAGGPAPSTGGGGGGEADIIFKIDTRYQAPSEEWNNNNPTTKVWMWLERFNPNFFKDGQNFLYNWSGYISPYNPSGVVGPAYPMTIDWGDGNVEEVVTYNTIDDTTFSTFGNPVCAQTHSYAVDGEYTVKITGESAYDIQFAFLPLVDIIKYDSTKQSSTTWNKSVINTDLLFFNTQWAGWDGTQSDIENWDTSNYGSFHASFAQASGSAIGWRSSFVPEGIKNWDVSSAGNNGFSTMFAQAGSPSTILDIGSWTLPTGSGATNMFKNANFVSGARYDQWQTIVSSGTDMFIDAFRETPGRGGGLPPLGNWELANSISDGATAVFSSMTQRSGISDEMWGEAFTSWASQSNCPINIAINGQVGGANRRPWLGNYWEASGSFKTGADANLLHIDTIEASASFSVLTSAIEDGGKGWTIPNVTVLV